MMGGLAWIKAHALCILRSPLIRPRPLTIYLMSQSSTVWSTINSTTLTCSCVHLSTASGMTWPCHTCSWNLETVITGPASCLSETGANRSYPRAAVSTVITANELVNLPPHIYCLRNYGEYVMEVPCIVGLAKVLYLVDSGSPNCQTTRYMLMIQFLKWFPTSGYQYWRSQSPITLTTACTGPISSLIWFPWPRHCRFLVQAVIFACLFSSDLLASLYFPVVLLTCLLP